MVEGSTLIIVVTQLLKKALTTLEGRRSTLIIVVTQLPIGRTYNTSIKAVNSYHSCYQLFIPEQSNPNVMRSTHIIVVTQRGESEVKTGDFRLSTHIIVVTQPTL